MMITSDMEQLDKEPLILVPIEGDRRGEADRKEVVPHGRIGMGEHKGIGFRYRCCP